MKTKKISKIKKCIQPVEPGFVNWKSIGSTFFCVTKVSTDSTVNQTSRQTSYTHKLKYISVALGGNSTHTHGCQCKKVLCLWRTDDLPVDEVFIYTVRQKLRNVFCFYLKIYSIC